MIRSAIMEAVELVVERRSKAGREARGIWYHGAQPKNLRSILSQGLKASATKNWGKDPDANRISVDRTSYGGVYVTKNLMTALSSATGGGSRGSKDGSLIIVMELQPKSLAADEDSFARWMADVPIEGIRWGGMAASMLWFGMMNMEIPDEIDIESMSREEYNNYTRARDNRRFYNEAWEAYKDRFYENYRIFNNAPKVSDQKKKAAEPVLKDAFHGAIKRMAGYFPEEYGKWWKSDWHRQYSVVDPKAKEEDLPDPPDPKEGEAEFRKAVDKITRIFTDPVTSKQGMFVTGRSLSDIKFSGSNRIIAVAEVDTSQRGTHKLVVHYGTLPADFFQQWEERWGSNLYVVDRSDKRLPEYDKYSIVKQDMQKLEENNDVLLGKLRQRLHTAHGKEKDTIRRSIAHLESQKNPKKAASKSPGLQVTHHDQVDPDVFMWTYKQDGGSCETFILVPKGEYNGVKVPKDTFIKDDGLFTHVDITYDFLKDLARKAGKDEESLRLLDECYGIVGKTPLSGRRYNQGVAVWGDKPTAKDLKYIRENFPKVKKVYYSSRALLSDPESIADEIDLQAIIAEAKDQKHTGWKIVSSDGKDGAVSLYDQKVPVDIKVGSITKNTYLGNSPEYVNMFFRAASDPEDAQDILLKFEYDEKDLIKGDPDFQNGEVQVKKAKLVSVHPLPRLFDDEDGNDIRKHLGESTTSDFADYLEPKGKSQSIGKEAGKFNQDGISRFISPYGSYRYVHAIDGKIVGALQVMSRDGKKGTIANVVVQPEHRRKGIAKELLAKAKKDFDQIDHSGDLSELGKAWKTGLNENYETAIPYPKKRIVTKVDGVDLKLYHEGDTLYIEWIFVPKSGMGQKTLEKLRKQYKVKKVIALDPINSSRAFWDKMLSRGVIDDIMHGVPSYDEVGEQVLISDEEYQDISDYYEEEWEENIEAHEQGSTMWLDLMEIPKRQRRKGLGRKEYEEWEASLPEHIKLVKLMAADMGDGNSQEFWQRMGFDFVYTADDPEDIPYEYRQEMQKGVNGHPTPPPSDWNAYDESVKSGVKRALVLVHVDSLDSYASQGGPAMGLGDNWESAMSGFKGDTIVVSQGWYKEGNAFSREAMDAVRGIVQSADHVIEFDEAEEEWGPFLKELDTLLKKQGITQVDVGGIWYDPNGQEGCATEVIQFLQKQGYKVTPREELLGCEDDIDEDWEEAITLPKRDEEKRKRAEAALDEIRKSAFQFDHFLVFEGGHVLVEIGIFNDRLHLSSIVSGSKKKGFATKVMRFIMNVADKHGAEIEGNAKPFGDGGMKKKDLKAWYKKLGFEFKGDDMVRKPKEK